MHVYTHTYTHMYTNIRMRVCMYILGKLMDLGRQLMGKGAKNDGFGMALRSRLKVGATGMKLRLRYWATLRYHNTSKL